MDEEIYEMCQGCADSYSEEIKLKIREWSAERGLSIEMITKACIETIKELYKEDWSKQFNKTEDKEIKSKIKLLIKDLNKLK